jgi:GTP-binding protein HflX
VEAFKSTLEEVTEADLLLHVVDGASPERREQIEQVEVVLDEIGAKAIPRMTVYNKIDLSGEPPRVERNERGQPGRVFVSAQTGAGMDLLIESLAEHFRRLRRVRHLRLPPEAGRLRALMYEHLHVARETLGEHGDWLLEIELTEADFAWLQSLPDYRPEWLMPETPTLARTGS